MKDDISNLEEYNLEIIMEGGVSNDGLDHQIEEMIEKKEGVWKCKMCGNIRTHKSHLKDHAETHLGGISHACHICSKTFSTRHKLRSHKGRKHRA